MLLQKGVRLSCVSPFSRWLTSRHSCSKLFVGGLSYDTNETVLKEAFEKYGEIIEVKVICDHVFGRSKGYGFVRFSSESEANEALKEMDGQVIRAKNAVLEIIQTRQELQRAMESEMKMHFSYKLSERTN